VKLDGKIVEQPDGYNMRASEDVGGQRERSGRVVGRERPLQLKLFGTFFNRP
jgi:hypothetical protein